ncbi:MAG: YihY/virulence factor BrkB family protein, partial [Rhodospirillales bacterium]|nr:YihY/virulence factor BrkB family protein [Rhodospirillales bacterium]
MAAAGAAFYATMALFPAISTLISLYGLVFDRASVAGQLRFLRGLLPPQAYGLIAGRVGALVDQPSGQLGVGLAIASVIAFWSASAGTRSVLSALNVAYGVREQRGFVRFHAITLG